MPDILKYLRRLLGIAPRREQIRRTVAHPRLGALNFVGWRLPPHGPVAGHWEVTPAGTTRPVTVDLASAADGTPAPGDVAWLEVFLSDLDGFYARIRPALATEYAHWVGGEPPGDWRTAFRLDAINPPGYDDERPDVWQVTYWCSGAQHWFVIELSGRDVLSVEVEG